MSCLPKLVSAPRINGAKPRKRRPDSRRATPAAIAKRNERERNRVKQVNNGFVTLRQCVPSRRRMSKAQTLRAAIDYINYLQTLIASERRIPNGNGVTVNFAKQQFDQIYRPRLQLDDLDVVTDLGEDDRGFNDVVDIDHLNATIFELPSPADSGFSGTSTIDELATFDTECFNDILLANKCDTAKCPVVNQLPNSSKQSSTIAFGDMPSLWLHRCEDTRPSNHGIYQLQQPICAMSDHISS